MKKGKREKCKLLVKSYGVHPQKKTWLKIFKKKKNSQTLKILPSIKILLKKKKKFCHHADREKV